MTRKTHPKIHATSHEADGDDEVEFLKLTDRKHASKHQDGGDDEISLSGLAGQQIWVPYNDKIADINEDDTDKHFLDLEAALSETRTIVAIIVSEGRISGTGNMIFYPNEGTAWYIYVIQSNNYFGFVVLKNGSQRLQYSQEVANDDFDLYCLGYLVVA